MSKDIVPKKIEMRGAPRYSFAKRIYVVGSTERNGPDPPRNVWHTVDRGRQSIRGAFWHAGELFRMRTARVRSFRARDPCRTKIHQRHQKRSFDLAGWHGENSSELYTLYSGWALRFKSLPDAADRF
jgi:hypothetical protein